jgi:subtilisin family serine protease
MRASFSQLAAKTISAISVALLITTSILVLASQEASSSSEDASSFPTVASNVPLPLIGPDWRRTISDWTQYADDTGHVNAIITLTESGPSAEYLYDVLESDLQSPVGPGIVSEFQIGFRGFSTHLSIDALEALLASNPSVQAYPDLTVNAMVSQNVAQTGADQVWTYSAPDGSKVMGNGIVVAVVDTGVDYTHPDLGSGLGPSYKVIGGYDFYNGDADPMDDNGHGTHVAGIVAANGVITGVAPDASILAYKVLGADGSGSTSKVISGIEAAMDPNGDGNTSDHADIISLSLGGPAQDGDPLCLAVREAVNAGVVVVVAAGNDGPSLGTVASPGIAPEVITVGAVDSYGSLASFSSRGPTSDLSLKPEICAPGVSIESTVPYSNAVYSSVTGHRPLSGTSMATPHVSGAAALLLQLHPDWSPQQVKSALLTSTSAMAESVWEAGSGQLWIPSAANTDMFVSEPLVSFGVPSGPGRTLTISNAGPAATLAATTSDWSSLTFNGSTGTHIWTNISAVSNSSLSLSSQGSGSEVLSVTAIAPGMPEGYYDGVLRVRDSSHDLRISFGFALLSRLNVHVFGLGGAEVFDTSGTVWLYSIPDASISMGKLSITDPAPPATFLLPSGNYQVLAAGHKYIYSYQDPYFLSATVQLNLLETKDLNLQMSAARQMKLNLSTDEGVPIYVQDYKMFWRYAGATEVSGAIFGATSRVTGSSVFSLPKSKTIFVSDTQVTLGISVTGFSYSASMWDFMNRNWQHWYEFSNSTSTSFLIGSTADIQYFVSWEFNGVDPSTSLALDSNDSQTSIYETKYDIPGTIGDIWGFWGSHESMGADAAFYMRKGMFSSLQPFFSGVTRKTVVRGVFSEDYYPGSVLGGFFERQFYNPDFSETDTISSIAGVNVPSRYLLTPITGISRSERVGAGPFYPSLWTSNTNQSLVLYHPLLRDQSGASVCGAYVPVMRLYRSGSPLSSYDLPEFSYSPTAQRTVSLPGSGCYAAEFDYSPSSREVCNYVSITLGFSVPSTDPDPPRMTSLQMPQRFVPGDVIDMRIGAMDARSSVSVSAAWKPGESTAWTDIKITDIGSGTFASSIQTSATTNSVDLRIRLSDLAGNYLEYVASNASLKQVPVLFDITAAPLVIAYSSSDASVLLTGRLTDIAGNPLCRYGAVPIELIVRGKKLATILDDYVTQESHVHNGTIRFEWHFNPIQVFDGPNTSASIQVAFDLGIYQPIVRTITLRPLKLTNDPPVITLNSPTNNSLIAAGQVVDLAIEDDGSFTVDMYLDGVSGGKLSYPWDVNTKSWTDGFHILQIVAIDDKSLTTRASYSFDVDAQVPLARILYPKDGGRIPMGSVLTAEVTDARLADVYYSVDGGSPNKLVVPYQIDMAGWEPSTHTVTIAAIDRVSHVTSCSASFEIVNSSIAVQLENPANGGVVRSGIPITFSVSGSGTVTSRWSTAGVWQELGGLMTIPTDDWSEGVHSIIINSTSDLGGFDQATFAITIDGTYPVILLNSPSNNSFVSSSDSIRFQVFDVNMKTVNWTIWNRSGSTAQWETVLPLSSPPRDGYFDVGVEVVDKAGNKANAYFTFAMDSSPPVVSFEDWSSGNAIRPGQQLNITATDAFLSVVQCAIDSSVLTEMISPFAVNTNSLSGGIHQLTVVASDLSGKKTTANISFYVDAVAPSALITSSPRVTFNATCTVTASVSDDYGISVVQLFYELRAGGYGSVVMAGYDGVYVAELAPDLLWKGMTVYVLATDKVGNVAESPRMTLQPAASPFDGNLPLPGSPSGWGVATWAWIVSTNGLAVLGLIGVIALAGVVLYTRRRREEESTERTVKPKPTPKSVAKASPFAELPPPKPVVAASAKQIVDSVKAAARAVGQVPVPTRVPTAVASGIGAPVRAMLLDSIPEITFKPDVKSPEDDIDYGELIERELNTSAWKNSVFGKGIGHSAVSRESDARPDRPGIISGLKLMKIME